MKLNSKHALRFMLLGSAAILSTGIANAQTAPAEGEIVVTGRRPLAESEAQSLKIQKNSDSLVSVLSADAIGDLPDQNVAQAVARLPGVAIERDQGQGRYINLRGAPIYWTTLSFDGLSVVSPEGRQTRFDNIPSAIASQIVVQKALVPSMAGDTVAGNVDIRTRRAFDYKGQKITGKLGYGYVELGEGKEIDSSLVYSNIFFGGKFGLVAQGSYYTRDMATENWETDPYLTNTTAPSKRFASETKNKHYRLTRENYSFSLRGDYKMDENNTLFVSTINSVYHDDENRDQFIFQLPNATDAAGNAYTSAAYINANDPVKGTAYAARISARITYRDYLDRMTTNTLGGDHRFENGLNATWRLNYTWTDNQSDNPAEVRFATNNTGSAFAARPTVVYDFTNRASNIATLYTTGGTTTARTQGAQVQNVETFLAAGTTTLSAQEDWEVTKAYTAKADFNFNTKLFGLDSKIEFGGLFTTREKQKNIYNFTGAPSTTMTYSQLAQDGPYLGKQRLGYTFRYSNVDKVESFVATALTGVAKVESLSDYWNVREKIKALYVMSTTDFDWGNIVYGVRAEKIDNQGSAYTTIAAVGSTPASTRLQTIESSETLYYPSAHLNWNITDQFKARVGLTTSASRADFDEYRPNLTVNDNNATISGGNPFVKPEKQKGLDAYLEYYGSNQTFFSVGYYYKDLSDVLFRQTTTFGSSALNTATLDRSAYAFSTNTNGGDGYLKGFELFYSGSFKPVVERLGLPNWTQGFGLRASATLTDSEVNIPASDTSPARKTVLSGTSDEVYNIQAIYEKYGLSVRLAYQFRTPWLQSVGAYQTTGGAVIPNGNGDIYWDEDTEVDLSVRYQINKRYEVFFDALNLTNDGAARFADTEAYPIEYEKFGKRFIAGVRFNF